MRKTFNRLLSLLLSIMILVSMLPVTAFAADSADVLDSGTPSGDEPKHWIQQYQEYVLAQIAASGKIRVMAASGSASPTYSMISWASGESNRLVFANGAYVGDGIPKISLGGKVAFCGEWNGEMPSGDYRRCRCSTLFPPVCRFEGLFRDSRGSTFEGQKTGFEAFFEGGG